MHRSTSGLVGLAAAGAILILGGVQTTAWAARAKPGEAAAAGTAKDIPEALRPWTDWVLHGQERQRCPALAGEDDDGVCVWAGRLALNLDGLGGRFWQELEVFAPGKVALPGGATTWPLGHGRAVPAKAG